MDSTKKNLVGEVPQVQEMTPEVVSVPEISQEVKETQTEEPQIAQTENDDAQAAVQVATTQAVKPSVPAPVKDALSEQIEDVLEEDMTDLFLTMSPEDQLKFKEKGEETVSQIREMIAKAHIQTKKVFHLIKSWLKLIPGVNRFFLEQEAKIKTDKIKHLSE